MKMNFKNRMEAIDWIANYAENEGQFEILREQLSFNYIYTGELFLNLADQPGEVIMLSNEKINRQ